MAGEEATTSVEQGMEAAASSGRGGTETQIVWLAALAESARALNPEMAVAECFRAEGYRAGYIRFEPTARREQNWITHPDLDVVCLVLAGRGRLRHSAETTDLARGAVCRIPAGTPHDFMATDEPLELFYATIQSRFRSGEG